MLNFFRSASDTFYGTATTPGLFAAQQHLADNAPSSEFGPALTQNPLLHKQAIIVLREELEYFAIPPKDGKASTDENGNSNEPLLEIKRECGQVLLEKRNIFTALQRNVNKENNVAEQHLIDMLCMRYVFIYAGVILASPVPSPSDDCGNLHCVCDSASASRYHPCRMTAPERSTASCLTLLPKFPLGLR